MRPTSASPPRRRVGQFVLTIAALSGLAWAGYASFRTWRAAEDESAALLFAQAQPRRAQGYFQASIHWRPDDAALWRAMAVYTEFGTPQEARRDILRALALDPRDWRAWQALGLIDFQLGNLEDSRRDLTQATRFDHGFSSHFALGNLALALGDQPEFQREMAAALAVAPAGLAHFALSALVNHADLGPAGLADLLPKARAEVQAEGIQFFLAAGKLAAATAAWHRMSCQSYELSYCRNAALALANRLVTTAFLKNPPAAPGPPWPARSPKPPIDNEGLTSSAVEVWNRSVSQGILAQAPIQVGAVADGQFQHAWVGPAFSWQDTRVLPLQNVTGPSGEGNAVRLQFDGYQPDEAILFHEFIPVEQGATYSLSYKSRRVGDGPETGLRLLALDGLNRYLASIPARLSQDWSANSSPIRIPRGVTLVELAFSYARPTGQERLRDAALVADVQLKRISH